MPESTCVPLPLMRLFVATAVQPDADEGWHEFPVCAFQSRGRIVGRHDVSSSSNAEDVVTRPDSGEDVGWHKFPTSAVAEGISPGEL